MESALIALVWPRHYSALRAYLQGRSRTVLTFAAYATEELRLLAESAGGRLEVLDRLPDEQTRNAVAADAHRRGENLGRYFRSPEWRQWCQGLGIDNVEPVAAALQGGHRLEDQLRLGAIAVESLLAAAGRWSPELIVVSEDVMLLSRAAIAWGRQQGVPSLHLAHALPLGIPTTIHRRLTADVLAVFGERGAAPYLDGGIPAERLRATGNPAWDCYADLRNRRPELRAVFCREHGLDAARPIVVFAPSWDAQLAAALALRTRDARLAEFLHACRKAVGLGAQIVIKRHPHEAEDIVDRARQLAIEQGLDADVLRVVAGEPSAAIMAADVTVSSHSNFAVESLVAGTPAINLLDEAALRMGNGFGPEEGVIEVTAEDLGDALAHVLGDPAFRRELTAAMTKAAASFNASVDGRAAERCAQVMRELARPEAAPAAYVWQTHLNVPDADASQYHNWAQTHLFQLFTHPPRRLLDIGCGTGATGEAAKQAWPQAVVCGVELNHAAAEVARSRLDRVFSGRFEDADLEAMGIVHGSLDTVIVADVLEHMYDPWGVLVRLKPYLTPDAQIIASIPNIRNLVVMEELAKGNWRYEAWGLLDVTHIRFFTLKDIQRFFHETGYRVTQVTRNMDKRLSDLYDRCRQEGMFNLELEKMTLKNVTQAEMAELCTLQFFCRAELGAQAEAEFSREVAAPQPAYDIWRAARRLSALEGEMWEARVASWPSRPRVHLAVIVTEANAANLAATLQSVTSQLYANVGITIVAEAAAPAGWADQDNLAWRHATAGLVTAANEALLGATADWVAIVDAGDQLPAHGLLLAMEAAFEHPAWGLIYGDEDMLGPNGEHTRPNFKPDFDIDLARSYPYVGGLLLVRGDLFGSLAGFAADMAGIEDGDLVLRAWERLGDAGIGHLAEVLLHRREGNGHGNLSVAELAAAGRRSVAAHLGRLGLAARVEDGFLPLSRRVRYEHGLRPTVSIVIVARNEVESLRRTVEAVFAKTRYPAIELLVLDANSADADAREFILGLEGLGDSRVRSYRLDQDASLAALHNLMAGQAGGEFLLFLDFDATPLDEGWLDTLMDQALRPGIGAVGPRLLNGDGSVRQTGLVLGAGGSVRSAFSGIKFDEPGYFGRALVEQAVSAVGGGAFLVEKEVFNAVGGFDESFATDTAEADLCLRLTDQGKRILWTPHASLLCHGRARAVAWGGGAQAPAAEGLPGRWLSRLARDPHYNVNLKKAEGELFGVDDRTLLNWQPLPWRPLPRVLAHAADNMGCGQYRILGPMRSLIAGGRVQGWTSFLSFDPVDLAGLEADALVFQRQITDEQIAALERHARFSKGFRVFELDDLLVQLPGRSVHRQHVPADIAARLARVVPLCQRFVVSTEPLAEAYRGLNDDIRVVPNYLERSRWGELKPLRRQSMKPRVGWIGGVGHTGDLEMIADVVRELANEVDWVFMGMCPDSLRPHVREYHNGIHFEQYPAKVATLNLDLALAPLEVNPFNEAKSHLRILEYGILGYPVVCSDVYPYQGKFPVTRVRNRSSDWVRAIREHLADLEATARMGDELRRVVERDWMLEDHLDVWLKAWLP